MSLLMRSPQKYDGDTILPTRNPIVSKLSWSLFVEVDSAKVANTMRWRTDG